MIKYIKKSHPLKLISAFLIALSSTQSMEVTDNLEKHMSMIFSHQRTLNASLPKYLLLKEIANTLLENFPMDVIGYISKSLVVFDYHLDLSKNPKINDDQLALFTHKLTSLNLGCNWIITDKGIRNFVNLITLDLFNNRIITNTGISNLTNLTSLKVGWNEWITDAGISYLVNLNSLILCPNKKISNEGIKYLTNLTSLNLRGNAMITNDGIRGLTNLIYLDAAVSSYITDDGIRGLINLTYLDGSTLIEDNNQITDKVLMYLPKLYSICRTPRG